MSKHTPGPWKISGANTIHGPDCIVAFVGTTDDEVRRISGERQSADAHLIAAAPDLLAACEVIAATTWSKNTATVIGEQVRAAIAKARGK